MPAAKNIKSTRIQLSLSEDAQAKFDQIARQNGFSYGTGIMSQILENLSTIDPERFLEALVAAKQAGKAPEPVHKNPIGRPPLNKAS